MNSRPLMGNDWICSVATTWLTSVRVGSIKGASVLTSTTSVAAATFNEMSMVAICATRSTTSFCTAFAKPVNSADSS